ncbi:MAG TPA: NHL repeat-containing protein [Roseiflexaceae bacterium]|nr:NHL repeat-containing protein [Roseiflexaceae bacterium]
MLSTAVDPLSGKVFVSDSRVNRVLRFAAVGALTNGAAAEAVLGQPSFTSGGAAAGAQGMFRPGGLAFDAQGRLWVADSGNNRVLRFDNAATKPSGATANAVLGQAGFDERAAGTTAQRMRTPTGVAFDVQGRLWVADNGNNRVLRFDNAAGKASGAAADGVLGQPDFAASAFGLGAQRMHAPAALALDTAGRLWVVDQVNSRVLRFDSAAGKASGAAADSVLGQADFSTGASGGGAQGMRQPQGLALDAQGRLWVADDGNSRVLRFDNAAGKGSGAAADGVLGQPDFTGTSCRTSAQGMCGPSGLARDGQGRLWVVDDGSRRVLRFDSVAAKPNGASADGVLGQPDLVSDVHINARALASPTGVAVDPTSGKLFVADMANNRVLRYASRAALSNGAAAEGVLGQPGFSTQEAGTTAQRMRFPMALTVDTQGRLWVADRDNNRVLRFDNAAGKPNGAAADGVLGKPDFAGFQPGLSASALSQPSGLAIDPGGHIWLADADNSRVLLFDPARALTPRVYVPYIRRNA